MQFFQSLLPGSNQLCFEQSEIDIETNPLTLSVASMQASAQCPLCGQCSQRIHRHSQRTLADLPCVHFTLTLLVTVCQFFCPNPDCHRQMLHRATAGSRSVKHLQAIGGALGGVAGAQLAWIIHEKCNRDRKKSLKRNRIKLFEKKVVPILP